MNILTPPKRIYLQWHQGEEEDFHPDPGEITWCEDKVHDDDLEYVLVSSQDAEK